MKKRTLPPVLTVGEVVQTRPALLTTLGTSLYTAVSVSKLEQLRAADTRAVREGRPLAGPKWVVLSGSMVRYRVSDLDDWLRENARELAVAEPYRRHALGAAPPLSDACADRGRSL